MKIKKYIDKQLKRNTSRFYCSFVLTLIASSVNSATNVVQGSDTTSVKESPTVVSINLCADQLVMQFAEPSQILSLSNLSHEKGGSYFYEKALEYPVNSASSEQILALEPDIVIAGEYSAPYTLKILSELGVRVETVTIPNTFEQLFDNIRNVSAWLGKADEGIAMIEKMQSTLGDYEKQMASMESVLPTAAYYSANGYSVGDKTLKGQLLQLSGWKNVATESGIEYYGTLSLESLISLSPDAIISSPYSIDTYSRAQQIVEHPAIKASGLDPMVIDIPSSHTICAGPWTIDLIALLSEERDRFLSSPN